MRWTPGGMSGNIEDRRGGGAGIPLGIGGTLILALLSIIFGQDFFALIGNGGGSGSAPISQADRIREEPKVELVSFVLDDAQNTWREIFRQRGHTYQDAKLVLFRDVVRSACGSAGSATGPFYCPGDQKVYIDLGFYEELRNRFRAPGDFAEAYVIAHEVGHHVQNLLGISGKVAEAQQRGSREQANALSVRVELQADCLAGVWANHADASRHILERGDLESGLNAASAIGDDRLQMQSRGYVSPESFTHGSSQQRVRWFKRGLETGSVKECDTFKTAQL